MNIVPFGKLPDSQIGALRTALRALSEKDEALCDAMTALGALALSTDSVFAAPAPCWRVGLFGHDLVLVFIGSAAHTLRILTIARSRSPVTILSFNSPLRSLVVRDSLLESGDFYYYLTNLQNLQLVGVSFARHAEFDVSRLFQAHFEHVANLSVLAPGSAFMEYFHAEQCVVSQFGEFTALRTLCLHECGLHEVDLSASLSLVQLDFSRMPRFSPRALFLPPGLRSLAAADSHLRFLDLRGVPGLLHLDLSYNRVLQLQDAYMPQGVQELRIEGHFDCGGLFSNLQGLQLLQRLSCAGNTLISYSAPLSIVELLVARTGLRRLDLRSLRSLQTLDISDNPEIELAENFIPREIRRLAARGSSILFADVAECISIESLDFSGNYNMRFSYQQFPKRLKRLLLAGCRVLHIDIRDIEYLTVLDIADCYFEEILWNERALPLTVLTAYCALSGEQLRAAVTAYAAAKALFASLY